MATRDILVLNTTASRAETQQSSDTVVVRGDGGQVLSVENSSGTSILSVNTVSSSVDVAGKITATTNVSSSLTSTGSFGRIEATTLVGDAFNLTNTEIEGTISSSGQIANQISGSFRRGFEFTGTIGDSVPDQQNRVTASFGKIFTTTLSGSAAGLTNTDLDNTISSSAQIADDISGSFNKGFEFDGTVQAAPAAWSKGPAVPHNTARSHVATGASPNAIITVTGTAADTWDGTSWTEITAAPNPTSYGMAAGAYDATIIVGGNRSGSISWNGSNWTEEASTNRSMTVLAAGAGTTEATLVFGGLSEASDVGSSANATANTEAYDGSSWSEVNDMLITRGQGFQTGIGSQNSTISYGGCAVPGSTVSPPSPYSSITFNDPRSQGDHLEEWDGTNWTYQGEFYAHPGTSYFIHSGAGVGTANAASFYGGYTRAYGGSGVNYSHYHWDGTAFSDGVSMLIPLSYNKGAGQGGATGAHANVGGYSTGANAAPNGANGNLAGYFQFYEPVFVTGSFGRIDATTITGDVRNMTSILKAGIVTGSGQLTVSGAFNLGFAYEGTVSGSSTTTGSFNTTIADKAIGNISGMSNILPTDIVSSSAQLAADISGSFNKGFEFSGTVQTAPAAWSTAANMPANFYGGAGAGRTQNAALHWSGRGPSSNSTSNCSQEWNGTAWSATNNFNKSFRRHSGAGNTESALSVGGYSYPNALESSEYFNGTDWSEKATLPHRGMDGATVGEDADILLVGGGDHPGVSSANTDKYSLSGDAWSQESDAPTNVGGEGAAGTSEAAIIPIFSPSEGSITYNGSNWSEIASTLTDRGNGVGIFGTQNNAVAVGGCSNTNVKMGCTEIWNGTSWTYGSSMNNGRGLQNGRTVGTAEAGVAFSTAYSSVSGPAWSCDTEAWNDFISTGSFDKIEVTSITGDGSNLTGTALPGTISSSGQLAADISGSFTSGFDFTGIIRSKDTEITWPASLPSGSFELIQSGQVAPTGTVGAEGRGMSGIQNAALLAGGVRLSGYQGYACTETWDGSAWSEVADLNDGGSGGASGTTNATVLASAQHRNGNTETWDGSSWTEVNNMIFSQYAQYGAYSFRSQRGFVSHFGHSQDCMVQMSSNTSPYKQTEEWNGTNWSTGPTAPADMREWGPGAGAGDSGLQAGGAFGSPNARKNSSRSITSLYNGVSWSEGNDMPQDEFPRFGLYAMAGSQNDAIAMSYAYSLSAYNDCYAGRCGKGIARYNGTVWYTEGYNLQGPSGNITRQSAYGAAAGTDSSNAIFSGMFWVGSPYTITGAPADNDNPRYGTTFQVTQATHNSASFTTLDAIEISASADLMTNIPVPEGVISGSAQIASDISGSFNHGFEFTGKIETIGAWSAGGTYPGPNCGQMGAFGTQNSAVMMPGNRAHGPFYSETYLYNGTSWSDAGANMVRGRGGSTVIGTSEAGIAIGGRSRLPGFGYESGCCTETWNGSAWSVDKSLSYHVFNLNQHRSGTQNAALISGGGTSEANSYDKQDHTIAWDGNTYTHVANMINARSCGNSIGTQNAALAQGSGLATGAASTCTEEWNGSVWSAAVASNFPTGCVVMSAGDSSYNNMVVNCYSPPMNYLTGCNCTDFYNGISWSIGPLANYTGQYRSSASTGTTQASFFKAGPAGDVEHFNVSNATASLDRVDATDLELSGDVIVSQSMQMPIFSGSIFPVTSSAGEVWYNCTEEKLYFTYDINSWTEVADTNTTHNFSGYAGGVGQGIVWGGAAPNTEDKSEIWDGLTWTEVNDLNTARVYSPGGGSSNAAIAAGGNNPGVISVTEIWDGTSWTEVNDGALGYGASFAGTVNAAVQTGGRNGSAGAEATTKEWNGTDWSTGGSLITARSSFAGMLGTQNAAKHMGGTANTFPQQCDNVEDYNGTSFSTGTSLSVATKYTSAGGTSNAGIFAGGTSDDSATTSATYEWNGISFHQTANLGTGRCTGDIADGSQSSFQVSSGGAYGGSETKTEQYTTTGIGCHCIGGV